MYCYTGCICLTFLHCVFSPLSLCVFKWVLKLSHWEDASSHWLHLFDFTPLRVIKWVLKLSVFLNESSNQPVNALSQRLHFLLLSIVWFYVFWNCPMQSHTDCDCFFLHCVCSNAPSNCLLEKMHSHTSCICLTVFFSNESSNRLFGKMHSHNVYIAFLHCCAFKWTLISHIWEDASHTGCIHWICPHSLLCFCLTFSTVHLQMTPQITFFTRCIVTLVALFFFFLLLFYLCPQFSCLRKCIVTQQLQLQNSHVGCICWTSLSFLC